MLTIRLLSLSFAFWLSRVMSNKFLADLFLLQRVPEPGATPKPTSFSTPQDSPGSPLYVPHSPLLGRPSALSPKVERELRDACAEIVKNFKPSGYEFMDLPQARARHACNRVAYKPDDKEKSVPEPQPPLVKKRPSGIFPKFRRGSTASETVGVLQGSTYQHVPSNAATSFANTTTVRNPSVSGRRASCDQSNDTRPSTRTVVRKASLNALNVRPHTASGVLDTNSNSSSTTRTNTTWDRADISRSTSATTVPSHSYTPPDNIPQSESKPGISDTSGADAAAAVWMTRELSKRRSEIERPLSRSSRIVNYLRPRPSIESIHSPQSANPPSGINWWNGNAVPKSPDAPKMDKPDPLDLNRALPPLPSLSTWNSNTTGLSHTSSFASGGKGVHIAQLMRGSPTAGKPPATVVDGMGVERTISRAEEKQREKDLRRLVEEKMKGGSIVSSTVSPSLMKARQKSIRAESKQRRKDDLVRSKPPKPPSKPKPTTGTKLEAAASPVEKKMSSFRRQLNKLTLGGMLVNRQGMEGRKAYGKVIEEDPVGWERRALQV
ncbi:MAG: hypothetical protein M1839_006657 [Geoglossum umbratile]|nr:MAG: hypothetical protein M1839_006657 [Geoglossum umbratile]